MRRRSVIRFLFTRDELSLAKYSESMMMRGGVVRPAMAGFDRMSRTILSVLDTMSWASMPTPATWVEVVLTSW